MTVPLTSRLIFGSAQTYVNGITWKRPAGQFDSEYQSLDIRKNLSLFTDTIASFFEDGLIYVAVCRNDSFSIQKKDINNELLLPLFEKSFSLWNEHLHVRLNSMRFLSFGKWNTSYPFDK